MAVRVVHVRYVGVQVFYARVNVPVRMGLPGWIVRAMTVLVMIVMHV